MLSETLLNTEYPTSSPQADVAQSVADPVTEGTAVKKVSHETAVAGYRAYKRLFMDNFASKTDFLTTTIYNIVLNVRIQT